MRRRGFSLVEMMLAIGMFGFITAVMMQVMVPGLRIFTLSQTLGEVETRSLAAHRKLLSEMADTTEKSIYWLEDPGLATVSFLSGGKGGYDPASGAPVWREECAYYVRQGRMCRRTWKLPDPTLSRVLPTTTAFALTPDENRVLAVEGTPLCLGVTRYQVSKVANRTWRVLLEVEALTQQERQLLTRESTVYVHN